MQENKTPTYFATALMALPLLLIIIRLLTNDGTALEPDHRYVVRYDFQLGAGEQFHVQTFLPINDERQRIYQQQNHAIGHSLISIKNENKIIRWSDSLSGGGNIAYQFEFRGKPVSYQLPEEFDLASQNDPGLLPYRQPSEYIQSNHEEIRRKGKDLATGSANSLATLTAFYDFVYQIPSSDKSELTDALKALRTNEASCNGKSRLMVALCRSAGLPARVVGGLILESTVKKTSHLWAEVRIGDHWVPFDPLNGHFASLPAHYLELYRGDEFLIKRARNIDFDYQYAIQKERINHYPVFALLDLWGIIDLAGTSREMLTMLLLLPFGALIVAISKNIIGLKTFGVFLPVLISFSLMKTGFLAGLLLFTSMILVVACVNYPLEKWGIQYNSKIACMLISVVVVALAAIKILHVTGWYSPDTPLFFPIIVLTIFSERFARKVEEESVGEAMALYGTTLLVTVLVYFLLSSQLLQHLVLTFPEIILFVAGVNLLLGRWIGIRLMEYYRFHQVISKSQQHEHI